MKGETTREIVIEIERVRTVRKRCNTHVSFCAECGAETDFIFLSKAAELFEVDRDLLNSYIVGHVCHIRSSSDEEILLCLPSLLHRIRQRTAEGGSKNLTLMPLRLLPD